MKKAYTAPQSFSEDPRPSIALQPVESNQVKAIGYDEATKTLAVQFTRGAGAIYHYPNVEPEMHKAFMTSESIGSFFGAHIKPLAFTKFAAEQAAKAEEESVSL